MNFVKQRKFVRDLKMPDGSIVKLIQEDTGVSKVTHRERAEGIDALVIPNPIIMPIRSPLS